MPIAFFSGCGASWAAYHSGVHDQVGGILCHTTQQVRDALAHIALGVVEPGEELGYDTLPGCCWGVCEAVLQHPSQLPGVFDQ